MTARMPGVRPGAQLPGRVLDHDQGKRLTWTAPPRVDRPTTPKRRPCENVGAPTFASVLRDRAMDLMAGCHPWSERPGLLGLVEQIPNAPVDRLLGPRTSQLEKRRGVTSQLSLQVPTAHGGDVEAGPPGDRGAIPAGGLGRSRRCV